MVGSTELASGNLEEARAAVEERLELLAEISAPDDLHFALMQAVEIDLAQGMLAEAERHSSLLGEMVQGLTAHHRLHGVDTRLRVETLGGHWGAAGPLTSFAERAVQANATTPCPGNASALLCCALASEQRGDSAEARRLERVAGAIGLEGWSKFLDSPRLRLALARNELAELRRLIDSLEPVAFAPYLFDVPAALLDALVALGERARIESEAPKWFRSGTYLEPFALQMYVLVEGDEWAHVETLDRSPYTSLMVGGTPFANLR